MSSLMSALRFKMSNIQDSEAHFASRALEYGLHAAFLNRLKDQGISTLGHLAFAVFRPGAEFEEKAFNDWATDVNEGVPLAMGAAAALRRLHFESEVVLTSTIRASVETPETGTPKPVPFAEKAARLDELRARFTGLNIHGAGEPSHALLDEACAQFETRVLRYIEPQKCTSRELEITSGRSDKKLKLDAGTLSVSESRSVPDEAISTTFHLAQCMRRRALAYEFSNLLSFQVHELYTEKLLKHLSAVPPNGYQATTLAQVLRADKEVFNFLAQEVNDIRPNAQNVRPLDGAMAQALQNYNVTFHLVPLPRFAVKEDATSTIRRQDAEPYPSKGSYKGKRKGKGSGGKASGSNAAPKGYHGCVGRDAKNRPICLITTSVVAAKHPQVEHVPKEGTFVSEADVSKHMHFAKLMAVISRSSPSD